MDTDRIAGSAKEFAGKVEGTVGDIADDTKTQAAGRTPARQQARRRTYTARPRMRRAKLRDAAVGYAQAAYENSGDTFRDGSQAIAKKVQANPLGSMLIAGGIGFALALLMMRPPHRLPRGRYYG